MVLDVGVVGQDVALGWVVFVGVGCVVVCGRGIVDAGDRDRHGCNNRTAVRINHCDLERICCGLVVDEFFELSVRVVVDRAILGDRYRTSCLSIVDGVNAECCTFRIVCECEHIEIEDRILIDRDRDRSEDWVEVLSCDRDGHRRGAARIIAVGHDVAERVRC